MAWVTDYYKEELAQMKTQYELNTGKLKSKLAASLQQVNALEQQMIEMQHEKWSVGNIMEKLKRSSATIDSALKPHAGEKRSSSLGSEGG
jgi:hypothetical protein